MDRFVGTHENRLDAKMRVSVPARFREVLRGDRDADAAVKLMLRQSTKLPCIECWPPTRFERLARTLDELDPLSDEYEQRATVIYGKTSEVDLDKEGRIVLTPALARKAQVKDRVAFMGKGDLFQLWEPAALDAYQAEAEAATLARGSRPQ